MNRLVPAFVLGAAVAAGLIAGCASKKMPLPANVGIASSADPRPLPAALRPVPAIAPLGVPEHVLLTVTDATVGPFLARHGDVVLAVYLGPAPDGTRRLVALPLQPTGEPRDVARVVAQVPSDAASLVVRAAGGASGGFVAAWATLTDRGKALNVVSLGDDGRPRGNPVELARTGDDIVWTEVVPTPRGAIVVWAEETRTGDANVVAAALGANGVLRAVPNRVARGVRGWQVTSTADGAALALVAPIDAKSQGLTWVRLDADARPIGAPIALAKGTLGADVDVAHAGAGYVVAWTDRGRSDAQVMLATVTEAGQVRGPHPATDATTGNTLLGVTGGATGAFVAWEETVQRSRGERRAYVAPVTAVPSADADHAVALELAGRGAPELAPTPDGFAMLAPARACAEATDAACAGAPVLPTLLRFDAHAALTNVEPLRLGSVRAPATLAWGLSCGEGRCLALATSNDAPPKVRAVDLRPRPTPFRPPTVRPPSPDAPQVGTVATLGTGAFADVAAARVGDGTLVALLGAATDEGRREVGTAPLVVRALDAAGAPVDRAIVVSPRALAIGGVALAAAARPEDGAAIAWVAREAGDPQVHVTRVDAKGRRMNDVQLTTARGDASDVAIAWADGGWIVAWVDGRDGNGEVYATKVDRDLRRVAREERITRAPGDASDVTILSGAPERGEGVWLAWSDARESPDEGFADVYVAPIRAKDATRAADERRVLATAAHSRSPALAYAGGALAVAWIEEAPLGANAAAAPSYGAMLAWLDATGAPRSEPQRLVTGPGFPTAIALEGSSATVHAVIARSAREGIELDALLLTPDHVSRPYTVLGLEAPPSLDVALVLTPDALFYNDEAQDDRRARRAELRWPAH